MDFKKWIKGYAKRFFLFAAGAGAFGQTMSWLMAVDDAVHKWLLENRPLTLVLFSLSALVFGMYDFLQEPRR